MISEILIHNQSNLIAFVLVDANYLEVSGLGSSFSVEVSKSGGAFSPGMGAKAEIGHGWYSYQLTASECDTIGPLAVRAWGTGTIQQNLEYVVRSRTAGCIQYTYTVTNSVTLMPIAGVEVWITTDSAGNNVVWKGYTDAFGVARDEDGSLPCLDAGTYYFWKQRVGFIDNDNPDVEIVS